MDEFLSKTIDFFANMKLFKFFEKIKPFSSILGFVKDKEKSIPIIKYLICGVITTAFTLALLWLLLQTPLNENVANALATIGGVIVAYVLNRVYVFLSTEKNILKEFSKFATARAGTYFLDLALFYIFVTLLHYNEMVVKLFIEIIIIILNYIFSKLIVFKQKKKTHEEEEIVEREA